MFAGMNELAAAAVTVGFLALLFYVRHGNEFYALFRIYALTRMFFIRISFSFSFRDNEFFFSFLFAGTFDGISMIFHGKVIM